MNDILSLVELNNLIKLALRECFPDSYWVRAELSEVRTSGPGHCYVEFVEKDSRSGNIIAKMRGNIWANTFRVIKPYFEEETGQPFTSGIKVMVKVNVDFHEVYGPSLTVLDIDPSYTVGDMMRQRLEIIKRLKEEGIFENNKALELPDVTQRIAVISSATAAGFGDFTDQLLKNSHGFVFYPKLFPALMQGAQSEASILSAFSKIEKYREHFDAVVIIRGGGAVSELGCFDSYAIAKRAAEFSLPVITGIGHDRDESVLDMVAHTRMKTPTAVAEFLLSRMEEQEDDLLSAQDFILNKASQRILNETYRLQNLSHYLSLSTSRHLQNEHLKLNRFESQLPLFTQNVLTLQQKHLPELEQQIALAINRRIEKEQQKLHLAEQIIRLSSPETILKKGYSITLKEGKAVRSSGELTVGDALTTLLADGEITSIVSEKS
ncbi:exodeoxyribonuclease VII large subunit [Parabacteroides sp. FAFU027]|uniref:exodeoxyribonuclease VII large subunit n=1 Tax=Parabacteroides sp. FAFU027 TaxID=2922715 RepID=UPI001FAF4247|nr:exodeoxyribonuclease VII large subunit [Parabacteroides sp. FAFU027]